MSGILQTPSNVVIRGPVEGDIGYVSNTCFRSSLGKNRAPRLRRRLNDQIDRILEDKSTRLLIACSITNSDRILGWLLYSNAPTVRLLHYAYVREEERGKGIASRLVAQAWPASNARVVLTLKGPSTAAFLERKEFTFVPVDEVLR